METNTPTRFLSTLWQGGQYSYYWTAPNRLSYWFSIDDLSKQPCPNGGQNVYFGVNPVLQIPSKNAQGEPRQSQYVRSQNNYISAINALFGEFDFKDFGTADDIRNHLKQFPYPSIAIFSGGGYHFYWLLKDTFFINTDEDREKIRAIQANWVDFTGSDKQSKDIARVLRVPGTRNYKEQYAPDFPIVEIVKENYSLRYDLNYLDELSRPEPQPEPEPLPMPSRSATPDDVSYYCNQALTVAANMVKDAPDGEKHGALLRAARLLGGYIAGGIVAEIEAEQTLQVEINHKANVDNLDLAYKTIKNGIEYGKAQPITLEQKLAEREAWLQRNGRQQIAKRESIQIDRAYWARQYVGMWERVR